MSEKEFKNLFTPLKLGNIIIPNRIFNSAHAPRLFSNIGEPNEAAAAYYARRAEGGIGLIITSGHYVRWNSTADRHAAMESDKVIPALKMIPDAIHKYDTRCFAQLMHPGSLGSSRAAGGGAVYAASGIPRMMPFRGAWQEIPHAMDIDEIKRTVEAYGGAARRVKEAGYDGIEIQGMYGMLQASFLTPLLNHRDDEYGGSLENRMRFLLECIDAIRDNVGSDFVVGIRFSGDEFTEGGLTLDDAKEIAKRLEATGKLDYLFPCGGAWGPFHVPPSYFPLSTFAYLAAGIKEVVSLPVFCIGRINDPVLAESLLADHIADMIGMTRATVCDPEMPNKARQGRLDEIRRCMGCNEACVTGVVSLPITCTVNPEAGRELTFAITPAASKKKVMVIGGGAAGMEAARTAALRGHTVSLYEKNDTLAKELSIAAKCPGREDFEEGLRYYTNEMKRCRVDVHLGITVTPEMVIEGNYDAVVVATGALPFIPDIPGGDSANVVEMRQVLQDEVETGQNVIVADCQNHIYGLDVADFLAERGKKVELLTQSAFAGTMVDYHTVWAIYTRVLDNGVTITPLTKVKEVQGNTVVVSNVLTGTERQIDGVDTVVFTTDGKANDALYHSLKGKVKELYQVGQCLAPRKMVDSVYDGAVVGRKL
jgi:2,4-dienoyl-CoA reductase-like NADH-dependent reductase (Old Yellow Enzyme family)/thioredoxin reductase